MEQKTIVNLEHKLNDRFYRLAVDNDAPLTDVYAALFDMANHVLEIIKRQHALLAAEQKVKEDGQLPTD